MIDGAGKECSLFSGGRYRKNQAQRLGLAVVQEREREAGEKLNQVDGCVDDFVGDSSCQ